jgi:hypothetical protein
MYPSFSFGRDWNGLILDEVKRKLQNNNNNNPNKTWP